MILLMIKVDGVDRGPYMALSNSIMKGKANNRGNNSVRHTKSEDALRSEYIKFSNINNGSNLNPLTEDSNSVISVGTAFLVSSALAIAGHTTKLLDVFGTFLKKPISYVLDIASIMLGTITAAGFLADDKSINSPSYHIEPDVGTK